MPAYCVAANCNNSQTTPGITCTSSRAIDPQWGESGLNLYNSNELTFLLRRITPICVASTSVNVISQTPWNTHVEADTMFRYSFKILPDRLKLTRLYPCGSLGQSISFVFGARVGHFAATPQGDVVGIWSRDLGVMATLSVRQKMPFFRAFISLRSQFYLHHRSQRALTEIVSKITPNFGLVLYKGEFSIRQKQYRIPILLKVCDFPSR